MRRFFFVLGGLGPLGGSRGGYYISLGIVFFQLNKQRVRNTLRDLKRGSETREIDITHIHFLLRPRLFIQAFSVSVMNA